MIMASFESADRSEDSTPTNVQSLKVPRRATDNPGWKGSQGGSQDTEVARYDQDTPLPSRARRGHGGCVPRGRGRRLQVGVADAGSQRPEVVVTRVARPGSLIRFLDLVK